MAILQLLNLPNELLFTILSNLPARSILACGASCHRLRAVINGSMLLRGRIRSAKHGIQELLPSGLSLPDFETSMKQWENDWFYFKVGNEVATRSIYRPPQGASGHESLCPTKYKFLMRSGYLIQMHQKENPGWSHMDLSPLRDLRGFIKDPVWTNVRLGDHLNMGGWALDLDQDLVAASLLSTGVPMGRLEIHIIHFTTGKRHKSANITDIQLEFEGKYDRHFGTHIEIMGNYVVILIAHGTSWRKYQTLYLVDWIKGHVIHRQRSSANTYFPVLTSISEDTFVLGLKSDWALALCRITKEGDSLTFCTLRKLKLPDVWYNTRIQLKNFNRAPSGPDNPSAPKRHSTLPFRNSPSESVLSFYVEADRGWNHVPTILFFYVHPSALRALAERVVTPRVSGMRGLCHRLARCTFPSPKTPPITVPWKNWGPETTRWIEPEDIAARQSLSGTRCAISKWAGEEVQLLDFNPTRVRKLEKLAEEVTGWENLRELLKNSQSTISARKYFKHDIVSHLPYFEIRKRGAKGQLLIDDQWVVQTQYDGSESWIFEFADRGHTIWMHSVEERVSK